MMPFQEHAPVAVQPPSPEMAARLHAENEALAAQAANQALRAAAGAPGGAGEGNVSVVRDAAGKVVVTTRDGRTVTIDPKVGLEEDAVQEIVQTALEPPRIPEPPRGGPPESVLIVGIVFSSVLLMTLIISLARAFGRRGGRAGVAAQGVPAELSARLARIEQAVEAVAIEVERISESERYSARLLTERLPERLAEPTVGGPNGQGLPLGAAVPTVDATR